ncbi:MAG: hypothetical protein ACJAXJ_002481, partial [Colwellia sp.]
MKNNKITYKKDSDSSKIFSPQKQQPKSLPQWPLSPKFIHLKRTILKPTQKILILLILSNYSTIAYSHASRSPNT